MSGVHSAAQIGELSKQLGAIADWLEKCGARHADDMAELVLTVCEVLEDFYDEQLEKEQAS